jgi:putative ATPase
VAEIIKPLSERMRPKTIDDVLGQAHLLGEGKPLRRMVEQKQLRSIIFWGPPGVGKTTLAMILSKTIGLPFEQISAISAGVKDIKSIIEQTKMFGTTVLFIDEIHRFNKSQQDALLGAVESGQIILLGATTENPSFEVNAALLSRCQVYTLEILNEDECALLVHRSINEDKILCTKHYEIESLKALYHYSGGDARKMLNILELCYENSIDETVVIHDKSVASLLQKNISRYDKNGEQHYDIISAFIKSMRGSDPNAAVYWLARMLQGGEDPLFIARRMLILASEDIGNANPNALLLAQACMQACQQIGMPECRIILSQTVIYLATSPKSNSAYLAIGEAMALAQKTAHLPVPLPIRNAPTNLMKQLGYSKDYKYAHDFDNNFVYQDFMPEGLEDVILYHPAHNSKEQEIYRFLKERWSKYK